ncbi:MAG TPA: hypothetical protein VGY55_23305 [Pirellulales bacterium]|nr:hypothetical protein [Pirellulales bacterium]
MSNPTATVPIPIAAITKSRRAFSGMPLLCLAVFTTRQPPTLRKPEELAGDSVMMGAELDSVVVRGGGAELPRRKSSSDTAAGAGKLAGGIGIAACMTTAAVAGVPTSGGKTAGVDSATTGGAATASGSGTGGGVGSGGGGGGDAMVDSGTIRINPHPGQSALRPTSASAASINMPQR